MRTTSQDTRYSTAKEYKEVVSTFFIIPGIFNLNFHEKINLRNNIQVSASGVTNRMQLKKGF